MLSSLRLRMLPKRFFRAPPMVLPVVLFRPSEEEGSAVRDSEGMGPMVSV